MGHQFGLVHGLTLFEIGTDAERARGGTRQNDCSDLGICRKIVHTGGDLGSELCGDGVQRARAVEHHKGDVVIDAVGRPETWKAAFYARDLAGTVVLVGVPTPDMKVPDLPLIDVFGRGGALKSSWYGDCLPSRDFPMLVDLYTSGRLDLDAFVTEEIGIDDVEAAFDKMHHGDVLRSVVVL